MPFENNRIAERIEKLRNLDQATLNMAGLAFITRLVQKTLADVSRGERKPSFLVHGIDSKKLESLSLWNRLPPPLCSFILSRTVSLTFFLELKCTESASVWLTP